MLDGSEAFQPFEYPFVATGSAGSARLEHHDLRDSLGRGNGEIKFIAETFQKIILGALAGLYAKCKLALKIGFI